MKLFSRRTESTWKRSFELRKEMPHFFELKRIVNKSAIAIEIFKTDEHCKKYAYALAQANNFQGSSEFYWKTSRNILDIIIKALEAEIDVGNHQLQTMRFRYKTYGRG